MAVYDRNVLVLRYVLPNSHSSSGRYGKPLVEHKIRIVLSLQQLKFLILWSPELLNFLTWGSEIRQCYHLVSMIAKFLISQGHAQSFHQSLRVRADRLVHFDILVYEVEVCESCEDIKGMGEFVVRETSWWKGL